MNLFDKLKEFNENINGESSINDIQKRFEELAPIFLYGGHIKVRDDYKVFVRIVEFYFHSEKDKGVHDPIVYHRNGRDLKEAPYFPLMSLHAHSSGFDITFEKPGEYRASALIRSYEVKNNNGEYFVWNKENKYFEKSSKYGYNKQSTYLYALLNGFAFGNNNDITWEVESREFKKVPGKPRQNVFKSESEWKYINTKKEKCDRKWSFTREEQI